MYCGVVFPIFCFLLVKKGFSQENINTVDTRFFYKPRYNEESLGRRGIRSVASALNAKESEKETEPFLTLIEEMQNLTLQSGQRASFRCKVDGYPMQNVTYTWYKDNLKLMDDVDPRVRIRDKSWGSRLQISDAFSTDSGLYRCEASNTFRRVHTSAFLKVSFNPLPDGGDAAINDEFLKGKCEIYQGYACSEFFDNDYVYLETFQEQPVMEQQITLALKVIAATPDISVRCQSHAKAAFCYYVFPPCDTTNHMPTKNPKAVRLCQEDCDLLKHDICRKEFFQQSSNTFISEIVNQADCSPLPSTSTFNLHCTRIGLPSVINRQHKCYNDSGESYRGTLSVTVNGNTCQAWPSRMLFEHLQLSGGHNFCRNPGKSKDAPWCFINEEKTIEEICQVPLCNFHQNLNPDLIMILIPAVSLPILLGCFVLIFCFACKKTGKTAQHAKGIKLEKNTLSAKKAKVPELSSNVVHVIGELGDGKFGKVLKAQIGSNLQYCPNDPVAVKTLLDGATSAQVHAFQMEMETFSTLQHPNIACMKAVVVQPSLRCMIFEYADGIDLHEYLVLHSPQSDFTKPPCSTSSYASSIIDHVDFIKMGIQISAGMEYLTTHNFIHRDLAARNVFIYGNMDMKICNLGVVRESYISSYYRSPQGGQMLPIRWMAPESLRSWQFSGKSAVWSFGVLLWEMFSYGLQPYCGFSNHEVLDMVSRRQLLTCPDQCPAKMYALMHECWSSQVHLRPQFKDIHAKLVGWEGINTTSVTSQLTQGIHRQLNDVIGDGRNGQYAPYNGTPHETTIGGLNGYESPPSYSYPLPPGSSSTRLYDQNLPKGMGCVREWNSSGRNRSYNIRKQLQEDQPKHMSSRQQTGQGLQNCPCNGGPIRSSENDASTEGNHNQSDNINFHLRRQTSSEQNVLQSALAYQQRSDRDPRDFIENEKLEIDQEQLHSSRAQDCVDDNSTRNRTTTDDFTNAKLVLPSEVMGPDHGALVSDQDQRDVWKEENSSSPNIKPILPTNASTQWEDVNANFGKDNPPERDICGSAIAEELGKRSNQEAVNRKVKVCESSPLSNTFEREETDSNRPLLLDKCLP